jgi:hypothetical protein
MIPKRSRMLGALFLGGMLSIHIAIFWLVRGQIAEARPDFVIYYTEARIFHSSQPASLYDEATEGSIQRQVAAPGWTPRQVKPYMHPPFEILLFAPLGSLSFVGAYAVWGAINLLLLLICVLLLRRTFLLVREFNPALCLSVLLSFFPIFLTILEGQDTLFVLLAYICSLRALRRNADLSAGAWLGLGLVRPHLVLPFVFILALRRKWTFLGGFALSMAGAAALSILVVGWQGALRYPRYIWSLEGSRSELVIPAQYIPNLRGLVEYFAGRLLSPTLLVVLTVLASVLLAIWAASKWASVPGGSGPVSDVPFCIALVAASLMSYHEFIYDFSILMLPIVVTVNAAERLTDAMFGVWRLLPILLLFLSPLYVLLWYRWGLLNLMALVELGLVYGLSREIPGQEGFFGLAGR